MMKRVETKLAPAAIGPYSQAVICNGMVYTSGQIPLSPADGGIVGTEIREQAKQALENLKAVLEAAGSGPELAVKTTCFLTDMGDFPAFNEVYAQYFPDCPARSCVGLSALPKGVKVEVEAIAQIRE